jgi:hypothetical protein
MGVGLIGAACSGGSSRRSKSAPSGSIGALISGATGVSVLGTGADAPPTGPGKSRFGFDLIDQQSRALVGGSPDVWLGKGTNAEAIGPFRATWYPFTAYQKTRDRSPQSPIPGDFTAELDVPGPGDWTVAVIVRNGSTRLAATGILPFISGPVEAGVGTIAISTPTPVATTTAAIEAICTRTPVDHMHSISLDEALKNGKPTVVCFSTPLLCTSRLCGPVTDEQILVFEKYGPKRANFIHVEEFLPGPHHRPPAATLENQSPAFKAWKLQTEPWLFVIDRKGVIRFRSLGPVTAPEIEARLKPLL